MRRALADTLVETAGENDRVIFLTGDLGFQVFDDFKNKYGPRYINVGVAEAQLMCAAAGLAMEGWRPVAYSIAPFATARPFEQIRISICYPGLPVVIVGAGGGYTYASSGVTHQAPDDLGLMSLLPGMTVVAPGSPEEVAALLPTLIGLSGPSYLRVGKYGERNYDACDPIRLGKARLVRDGERVAVIAAGDIITEALDAVDALQQDGITPLVYQMHTVKPLDTAMLDAISARVSTIVTIEEHLSCGGLYGSVSRWRSVRENGPRILPLGAGDSLVLGNPDRHELRRRIGCDAEGVRNACRAAW